MSRARSLKVGVATLAGAVLAAACGGRTPLDDEAGGASAAAGGGAGAGGSTAAGGTPWAGGSGGTTSRPPPITAGGAPPVYGCMAGELSSCSCPDGTYGTQSCIQGSWTACQCAPTLPPPPDCGAYGCPGSSVQGMLYLPGCCGPNGKCGVDLSPAAAFAQVSPVCEEFGQPGYPDTACPAYSFSSSVGTKVLQGCCRPSGLCGLLADFQPEGVGDFGCAEPTDFGAPPASSCWAGGGCVCPPGSTTAGLVCDSTGICSCICASGLQ